MQASGEQSRSGKTSILFLAAILLTGLLTIFPYGAHLDQFSEQGILFSNVKEYLLHIPGGESLDLVQDMTDAGVLEISIDEDRDHGMAVYYPLFFIWWLDQYAPCVGNIVWHVYTFLIVYLGICSLFFMSRELFQENKIAIFTTMLFFLSPRMFAESHYNDKDMVLLSFVFIIFYQCLQIAKTKRLLNIVLFAVAGALTANIRIIGLYLFGVAGLYLLVRFIALKQFDKGLIAKVVFCILLWLGLFLCLTPASWNQMGEFFRYLFFNAVDYNLWHDYVLFQGRMLHQDYTGMPKKYLPVMILLTTPVVVLLLSAWGAVTMAAGALRHWKSAVRGKEGFLAAVFLAVGAPLAYAVLSATPLYNGWRHFYFFYAAMILLAGYGSCRLWESLKRIGHEKMAVALGAAYLAVLAVGILCSYPQEHSYYNILAGRDVAERYELDYWDMSVKQAYDFILEDAESAPIYVGGLNLPTLWGIEENLKILPASGKERILIAEDWEQAQYVIINTTYAFMYSEEDYQKVKSDYQLVHTISSYGNAICEVYRRPR